MITPPFATSAMKNSVTIKYVIVAISLVKYKVPKCFPVVFHNLSGYDSHMFIKTLGNSEEAISCIPNNEEYYISFTKQVIIIKFVNKEGK